MIHGYHDSGSLNILQMKYHSNSYKFVTCKEFKDGMYMDKTTQIFGECVWYNYRMCICMCSSTHTKGCDADGSHAMTAIYL